MAELVLDAAAREPSYYPASHEFNPSIRYNARSRSRRLILFSLGLISHALLMGLMFVLAACTYIVPEPLGLQQFPLSAKVDERLHLSAEDRDQIFRLIAHETSQPISFVEPGIRKGTVDVTCGYWESPGVPHVTGTAYTLQKSDAGWRIIERGSWIF